MAISTSLLSGIIGVIISAIYFKKLEKHKIKVDTAKRLLGNRNDIMGHEFSVAMNEVFIVFADSAEVISTMEELYNTLQSIDKSKFADDKFIKFLKAVCKDVGIEHKNINDAFFLKTFNPKSEALNQLIQTAMKMGQNQTG